MTSVFVLYSSAWRALSLFPRLGGDNPPPKMWEALHARIAARLAATPSLALLLKPFHMYNNALEKNPFAVKSVTSGIMYCAGEMLCQAGEQYNRNKELPAAERRSLRDWRVYDWKRAGLFLLYGTVIAGPLYHIWFNRLDQLPAAMYKLRQHRHKTEILKAFRTLQRYGIEVKLKLDNLPSAKPCELPFALAATVSWTGAAVCVSPNAYART